jgi:hypothetical protein
MINVGNYRTRGDAELAQTALTVAGIPSLVVVDDAGGSYPFPLMGAARLLVDEANARDAVAVLSERSHANRNKQRSRLRKENRNG